MGSAIEDILSSSRRALIRIDSARLRVPTRGRNTGRVRVKVFCRRIAVRTCSGTMKIRTTQRIRPQSLGAPRRALRRVTFSTEEVQLDEGKVGFVSLDFNSQRRSLLRRLAREGRRSVTVEISVAVIDADNNRQNVRRNSRLMTGR